MQASQVIPFSFEKQSVRIINVNGNPWFCLRDVCAVLELNQNRSIKAFRFNEEGVEKFSTPSNGGAQDQYFISEGNVFRLIARSNKHEAIRMEQWIFDEVLPSIRRTGRYEDTTNKMATLIGQTIGTDGFHCLGAVLDGKLRQLPAKTRHRARMHIWSQVHKAFSVVSAQDIPADQLDSARNFIAAYTLEGEWLPKETPLPPAFDIPQTASPQTASVLQRWLVSYDGNGKQQAHPIPFDAFVMSAPDFLARIDRSDGIGFTKAELFDCALASINQLRRQVLA